MPQILLDRIQLRLDALGLSQFEAAVKAGKNRNYIYDIMVGTKKSFRNSGINDLAAVLGCSAEYLWGSSDDVGASPTAPYAPSAIPAEVPFAGVIEAGAFRSAPARWPAHPPLAGDLRFPIAGQSAYLVRGEDFPQIHNGMFVIAVDPAAVIAQNGAVRVGDVAIIERSRKVDDEVYVERTLKRLDRSADDCRMIDALGKTAPPAPVDDFIVGIMTAAYLMV